MSNSHYVVRGFIIVSDVVLSTISYVALEVVGMLLLRHCFGKQKQGFPLCWHLNQQGKGMQPLCLPGGLRLTVT